MRLLIYKTLQGTNEMTRETIKATGWGTLVTLTVALLIVIGSRNLSHFDAALVGYMFAVLFAAFGVTYRYAMWMKSILSS
jgi:hypothetical protein